jgi:hypothetical protein
MNAVASTNPLSRSRAPPSQPCEATAKDAILRRQSAIFGRSEPNHLIRRRPGMCPPSNRVSYRRYTIRLTLRTSGREVRQLTLMMKRCDRASSGTDAGVLLSWWKFSINFNDYAASFP